MNIRLYLDKFITYMRNLFKYEDKKESEFDNNYGIFMRD
jgi:hypothetical protein